MRSLTFKTRWGRFVPVALVALASLLPSGGRAEEAALTLPPKGTTVRASAPTVRPVWLMGSYEGAVGDTLRIATKKETVGVPRGSVLRLERLHSKGSYAGTGRSIGFFVGALALGATAGATGATDDPAFAAVTVSAAVLGGGLIGMLVGWPIGASIPRQEWKEVSLCAGPCPIPTGSSVRAKGKQLPGRSVSGTLSAPITDSLVVTEAGGAVRSVPTGQVKHLEVSLGHKPPSGATKRILFGLGLAAGAVVGGLVEHESGSGSYGGAIAIGAAVGATTGWGLGSLLGRIPPSEVWEEVPRSGRRK